MTPISRHAVSTSLAVVVLSIAAAFACLWFTTPATRSLVPAVFTVVVVVVALRFGAAAGILGSLVGAAIFARWLYAPFNSLSIHDAAAREHLGWMLLAGISLSYLLAAPGASEKREPKQ
jgi:K+-sensing histidine kinase KdpD